MVMVGADGGSLLVDSYCKSVDVARITYTVLVETLNPAQSINQSEGWQLLDAESAFIVSTK